MAGNVGRVAAFWANREQKSFSEQFSEMNAQQDGTGGIDVGYVAHLARIVLTEEETSRFQSQLEDVVGYVKKINEVDLGDIEPTAHAVRIQNVFRDDAVCEGLDHDTVMANAPQVIHEQFQVPKIVE